jgi:hypothetical protein
VEGLGCANTGIGTTGTAAAAVAAEEEKEEEEKVGAKCSG